MYELQEVFVTPGSTEEDQKMVRYLRQKYEGKKIDIILGMVAPRYRLMLQSDPGLFADVPKIFYDFEDERDVTLHDVGPHVTGVWVNKDFRETLDLALSLQPDAKRVVVVSGNSTVDQRAAAEARNRFRDYETKLPFTYLTDLSLPELRTQLAGLKRDCIVLMLGFSADREGNKYAGAEALAAVARTSGAPIYGFSDRHLGFGMVGGSLLDFPEIGKRLGQVSLRVLSGERAETIPSQTVPNVKMFDWRELQRWGISERTLPPGSVVQYKQPSLWESYKWYVSAAVVAILVETFLIGLLFFSLRRAREAEHESHRLTGVAETTHRRLDETVSNVPGIVWETMIDPGTNQRRTTFISDHVSKMLGYTADEWMAQPPGFGARIAVDEDRERVLAESDRVIATGEEGVTQFRWRAKDGRIVWTENYLSPLFDKDHKVIGLRGVAIDISDRKRAEEIARVTTEKDRAILEAVPDLMFLQTRDGVYLDHHCNDPKDLLLPPEAFIGKNMREVLPPELAEKFAQAFQAACDSHETKLVEYELPLNNESRWFEARIASSGENILSVIRDITERKRSADQLASSHRRTTEILESIGDAFYSVDNDLNFTYVNRKAEEIWAMRRQDLIGRNFLEVFPQAIGTHSYHECMRAIVEGLPLHFEAVSPILNRWVETSVYPTPAGLSVYFRDITERKRADDALRESEARLRRAQQAARVGTWEWNIATGESVWSEMIWELLGLEPGDGPATVERFAEFIHPEDRERAMRNANRVLEHGQDHNDEFRIVNTRGEVLWLSSKGRVIRSADGRPEKMIGVNIDVTDRHRALDKLHESQERFAKAFRSNPQPMSVTILGTGEYMDVNDSFLQVSGYQRDEVIGHTSLELKIWEDAEARRSFVDKLRERGSVVNIETRLRAKDGSIHILLSSAEQLEIEGRQCLLIASSDITERKLAQEALKESEARFRNMADKAPVMIWVAGVDKGCFYFNQQWLDFTGRPLEEELGDGWTDRVHPSDFDGCLKMYEAAFNSREPFRMEYRLRRHDDVYRWIIDTGTPRFSPTGEFLGYIGSGVDITDRKESEAALVFAHEALENAYAEVNQLKTQLQEENIYLQEEIKLEQNFGEIVGASDALKYVLFKIEQVAPTDSTVLITGETGTGKELVARAIHTASTRRDRTMVKVNCAALSASLIESELFGHERGAFTGALARKLGRFELAAGGTIFLDEIGELPLELQVKLLRIIQEGEFERLGSSKTVKVDVRIIAATNRNLRDQVNNGLFREDLWYRLNVFPITVPPLRQRRDDIPMLIEHFTQTFARKMGKELTSIAPATINALCNYSWPGNVRELANVIERAVINSHGRVLRVQEQLRATNGDGLNAVGRTLEEVEREYIVQVLDDRSWRIEGPNGAAHVLGMNPSTLRTRMAKLNIAKPSQRAAGTSAE